MMAEKSIDFKSPEILKAMDLAQELVDHCKIHNLPDSLVIVGVAWNLNVILQIEGEKAHREGRAYEINRIAERLGLVPE